MADMQLFFYSSLGYASAVVRFQVAPRRRSRLKCDFERLFAKGTHSKNRESESVSLISSPWKSRNVLGMN